MKKGTLYSLVLELRACDTATLPSTTGHLTHALFFDMIAQVEASLAERLHNEQDYKPFTVSALLDARIRDGQIYIQADSVYRLRLTLLDGGEIWEHLTRLILEKRQLVLRLGKASFLVERLLSTTGSEPGGWAAHHTWQELASSSPQRCFTLRFASPTAFSLGNRRFALFPEPLLVWDSLLRSWNRYAPELLHIEKTALREFVTSNITVADYALRTTTLHFPKFTQTGFLGTCTYLLKKEHSHSHDDQTLLSVAALARFAHYAGIGYKTTMGMGQARLEGTENGTI